METTIMLIFLIGFTLGWVGSDSICQCPPGQYLSEPCKQENQQPVCVDCPEGKFSDATSSASSCQDCEVACQAREVETQICTKYSNMVCHCVSGTYRTSGPHGVCQDHQSCLPGYGVKSVGDHLKDTVCAICTNGSFSPSESMTQTCQPCSKCPTGYQLIRNCVGSADTYCELKDCGKPINPLNGFVVIPAGTLHGDVANYSCEHGYLLVGPPSRTCIEGVWTYWEPTCIIQGDDSWKYIMGISFPCIIVTLLCLTFRKKMMECRSRNALPFSLPCIKNQKGTTDNDAEGQNENKAEYANGYQETEFYDVGQSGKGRPPNGTGEGQSVNKEEKQGDNGRQKGTTEERHSSESAYIEQEYDPLIGKDGGISVSNITNPFPTFP